jgi:hypothetical protein
VAAGEESKQALIVAPASWEFEEWGSAPGVKALLDQTRGYVARAHEEGAVAVEGFHVPELQPLGPRYGSDLPRAAAVDGPREPPAPPKGRSG